MCNHALHRARGHRRAAAGWASVSAGCWQPSRITICPPQVCSLTNCKATSLDAWETPAKEAEAGTQPRPHFGWQLCLMQPPCFGGAQPAPGIYTPTLGQCCSPLSSWLPQHAARSRDQLPCCRLGALPSTHCHPTHPPKAARPGLRFRNRQTSAAKA